MAKKSINLFKELVSLGRSVIKNEELSQENFDSFVKEKIIIKKYIPIMEKYTMIQYINSYIEALNIDVLDNTMASIEKEYITFYAILLYYTNIKFDKNDMSFSKYDILNECGFEKKVLDVCRDDVNMVLRIVNDCLSINVIRFLQNSISNLDNESVKENLKEFKTLLGDGDALNNIVKIVEYNDPNLSAGLRMVGELQNIKK